MRHFVSRLTLATFVFVAFVDSVSAQSNDSDVLQQLAPRWTGYYAGLNLSYGWADSSVSFSPNDLVSAFLFGPTGRAQPPSTPIRSSGPLGGFQVGYDWQLKKNWLIGAEPILIGQP